MYDAPEAGQLLAATGPVQQVSASVGEDITLVGQALGDYAIELRQLRLRLGALRADATALVTEVGDVEPSVDQADRSNELLSAVSSAVADFDEAQRRCANKITALYGGVSYRADNGDGVLEIGEYGATAEALDAAAANGGVAWGGVAQGAEDDSNLLSDLGHLALDAVGLIPVVGEVADLANAAWYTAEGDYLNAGLSAAAAVPLVGWAATGGKFAVKGVYTFRGAKAWGTGRPSMVPKGAEQVPFGRTPSSTPG